MLLFGEWLGQGETRQEKDRKQGSGCGFEEMYILSLYVKYVKVFTQGNQRLMWLMEERDGGRVLGGDPMISAYNSDPSCSHEII